MRIKLILYEEHKTLLYSALYLCWLSLSAPLCLSRVPFIVPSHNNNKNDNSKSQPLVSILSLIHYLNKPTTPSLSYRWEKLGSRMRGEAPKVTLGS